MFQKIKLFKKKTVNLKPKLYNLVVNSSFDDIKQKNYVKQFNQLSKLVRNLIKIEFLSHRVK